MSTIQFQHRRMHRGRNARRRGVSMVELLVALAISAALLTATTVALNASFMAYAAAAESAGTQTSTRMVTQRLMTLVRTSTAHGPVTLSEATSVDADATMDGDTISCNYIELVTDEDRRLRISYDKDSQQLWLTELNLLDDTVIAEQPLLGGVTAAQFAVRRRSDQFGVWVLERGSVNLTVEPDTDNTLAIDSAERTPIRVIASTMPRRVRN